MCALCMHRHLEREARRRENWKILFGSIQGNTSQTCYCTHLAVWLLFPASFCSLGPLLFLLLTKALASRFCRFLVCRKNFFVLSGTIKKVSFIHLGLKQKKSREGGKLNQVKVREDEGSRKFLEGDKKDSTQLFRFLRFGENVHSVLCQPKMIYYLMVSCKRLRLPLT